MTAVCNRNVGTPYSGLEEGGREREGQRGRVIRKRGKHSCFLPIISKEK